MVDFQTTFLEQFSDVAQKKANIEDTNERSESISSCSV
jgi:hypothetical protein